VVTAPSRATTTVVTATSPVTTTVATAAVVTTDVSPHDEVPRPWRAGALTFVGQQALVWCAPYTAWGCVNFS
jgi:hypothetical protein